MTRDEAKALLPVIQAFSEGRKIEYLSSGAWYEVTKPTWFDMPASHYRLAPEKREPKSCWMIRRISSGEEKGPFSVFGLAQSVQDRLPRPHDFKIVEYREVLPSGDG